MCAFSHWGALLLLTRARALGSISTTRWSLRPRIGIRESLPRAGLHVRFVLDHSIQFADGIGAQWPALRQGIGWPLELIAPQQAEIL